MLLLLLVFLLLDLQARVSAEPGDDGHPEPGLESYDQLFDKGVEAYNRGDWSSVILHMERALRSREALRKRRAECARQCEAQEPSFGALMESPGPGTGSAPAALYDIHFFRQIFGRAQCLSSCHLQRLRAPLSMYVISEEMELEFRKRSPYNYLQVAYYKIHKMNKAVAAAQTFFMANPDHAEMKQNLEYYMMMAGVKESDFKDLEAKPHMQAFRLGVSFYTDEESATAAVHFEKALEEYFLADTECRSLCEGPYDYDGYNYMEYSADLFQSITDHYVQILNCRQNCVLELALQPGREKPIEDFLPSHFNYLQFAYYNAENHTKAIECAKTALLFFPNDEVMNQNLAYYTTVLGEDQAKLIEPRENIRSYIRRSLEEKRLLFFAYDVFGIPFVDPDTWTPMEVMPKRLQEKQKVERETAARISEEIESLMKEIETLVEDKSKDATDMSKFVREGGSLLYEGMNVTMNSKLLNGSQRVVVDGFLSSDECYELQRLATTSAKDGDGYGGKTSPHTPNEKFTGVTVYRALKLGQERKVSMRQALLYYNVTDKVRRVIASYFRLDTPLHFSYSHLVCRTAIEDKQGERKDESHPVHVDNCMLNAEALMCVKEHPAYTFRDYSAILYLNEDFEGGNFYFTELDAKTVTAEVRPQCGRVVGFSSGSENPHGVKAVTKGQRCAIALWFTLDPRHNERERVQADDLVKMLFETELTDLSPEKGAPKTENPAGVDEQREEPPTAEAAPAAQDTDLTAQATAPQGLPTTETSEASQEPLPQPPLSSAALDSSEKKTEL